MVTYITKRDPYCKLALEPCTGKSETADHIISVEDGGSNRPDNLRGACHACNWLRGSRDLEDLQKPTGDDLGASQPSGTLLLMDGSEKPSHRVLLESMGVTRFAFSFWRAYRRGFPKTKPYMIDEYFAEDAEIFVDSGWMQAQEKLNKEELEEYSALYDEFLNNNLWRLSGATEMHLDTLGMPWITEWRRAHFQTMEEGFIWPVWIPEHGQQMLHTMARDYDNVAIPNRALEDTVIQTRLGALERQFQTSFHALNVADPDKLRVAPLATTSTISWASPQMRGETIVWDGTRLVRYQAKMKQQARSRYKSVVERAGLDHDKILADDAKEVTKLAIWSYLQMEKTMSEKAPPVIFSDAEEGLSVNSRPKPPSEGIKEGSGGEVEKRSETARNAELTTSARTPNRRSSEERAYLPVFAVDVKQEVEIGPDGETLRDSPVLKSTSRSLRQCNSCVVRDTCPAFQPDSECAFDLPVEVKTKEQVKGVATSMLELQAQRVAFARYAEELNGGYPDPNLSQEMDRFFRMLKNTKELEQNNDFMRISVERQTSGGVLSAIFGDRASALKELEQPVDSNEVMQQVISPDSY